MHTHTHTHTHAHTRTHTHTHAHTHTHTLTHSHTHSLPSTLQVLSLVGMVQEKSDRVVDNLEHNSQKYSL
jgi:hypothetical protein